MNSMPDQPPSNVEQGTPIVKQSQEITSNQPKNITSPVHQEAKQITKAAEALGDPHMGLQVLAKPLPETDIDARRARIDGLWSAWDDVQRIPELVGLFDRKTPFKSSQEPQALLQEHDYPARTKIDQLAFENWTVNLNPKFIKDGHMYLLRGDHPNLEGKGFYTRPYGYGKKTTEQLTQDLRTSQEVGYFLYGNEAYLKTAKPSSASIAQELAFKQSQIGGSSFVSTTTSFEAARAGTGNNPDPEEQSQYEVYVLRLPVDSIIDSNTGNYFGMEENEYLVPDYITPNEIVAKFSRDDREGVYQYMGRELGLTKEDLGYRPPQT